MSEKQVMEMFRDDKTWLEDQREMTPWNDGCQRLAGQLGDWVEGYSQTVCENTVDEDHPSRTAFVKRLWRCLGHHWRQASKDGANVAASADDVAGQIQNGRGYRRGGRLGGDPMRDVVLAVAMTGRDGEATSVFQSDYYGFSLAMAGKLDRRLSKDPDEWWHDLVDHLAGYSSPPGKLEKFVGRCGLQNWLGIVVRRFLLDQIKRFRKEENLTDVGEIKEEGRPAMDESLLCFIELVRDAVSQLPKDDVLLLDYVFVEGLSQKEVANILRIVPGNVNRRLKKAVERLRSLVKEAEECGLDEPDGLAKDMMENPRMFAELLGRAVEETRRDES